MGTIPLQQEGGRRGPACHAAEGGLRREGAEGGAYTYRCEVVGVRVSEIGVCLQVCALKKEFKKDVCVEKKENVFLKQTVCSFVFFVSFNCSLWEEISNPITKVNEKVPTNMPKIRAFIV